MKGKCIFLICRWVCFGGSFFQRMFNFRSHSKWVLSSGGQAGCVSREWREDEQSPDTSAMCATNPNEMETFSSGLTLIEENICKKSMRMIKKLFAFLFVFPPWPLNHIGSSLGRWIPEFCYGLFFLIAKGMLKTTRFTQHCEHLNIKFECTEPCGKIPCKDKYVRHHLEHVSPLLFVSGWHWWQTCTNLCRLEIIFCLSRDS